MKSVILLLWIVNSCLPQIVDAFAAKRGKTGSKSTAGGGGFGSKTSTILHTPDDSPGAQNLIQFVKAQGAKGIGNVEIGFDPDTGRRGLYATKNFKNGQFLCQVPSDCALALNDPNKNGEDAPTLAHAAANYLTMYTLQENMQRIFAPYLQSLPTPDSAQFSPTPDFFDDEEIDLLEFPRLIRQAKERKANIQEVAASNTAGLTESDLQFATWLVASRSFSFSMSDPNGEKEDEPTLDERGQIITKAGGDGDKTKVRVLVPFIDMANHSSDQPNAKLTIIDPEKDESLFALEATRPITAGKEIVISYGSSVDSTVELLLNYGFVPTSNRIDEFMLQKGGDEAIASLDGWTTTVDEDKTMLSMLEQDQDDDDGATLKKILQFRIQLKESYKASSSEEESSEES